MPYIMIKQTQAFSQTGAYIFIRYINPNTSYMTMKFEELKTEESNSKIKIPQGEINLPFDDEGLFEGKIDKLPLTIDEDREMV